MSVWDAVVDDLTEAMCVVCGTDRELTREPSLHLDGMFYGFIYCEDCNEGPGAS